MHNHWENNGLIQEGAPRSGSGVNLADRQFVSKTSGTVESPIKVGGRPRQGTGRAVERGSKVRFGALLRQPIEVAAQRIRPIRGPAGRRKRTRQSGIVQRHTAKSVNEEAPNDESLLRIGCARGVEIVDDGPEAQEKSPVF